MGGADWACSRCGFEPNFARRRYCFDCGEARIGGGATGAADHQHARSGPIGENGRRPLLAWGGNRAEAGRREADEPPTRRTPGASVAAIVEAARRDAAVGGGADLQAAPQPARPRATTDADGFTLVGRGGRPAAPATARASAAAGGPSAGGGTVDTRPAATSRADEHIGEEADVGQREGDHEQDGEEPAQQHADVLRQRWVEEAAVVKKLAKQGLPDGHPALIAAQEARDGAEAAWRKAKQPAPVATRLRWAQAKLNRALEMAEATGAAIKKAGDDHDRLMAQLHDRRLEDAARVRKRQSAVEELRREIGGGAGAAARPAGGDTSAILEACGGLCDSVGPELAALAERLPSGSDEWQTVNRLLATLATSRRRVEEAVGIHQPQAYDIGDDDGDAAEAGEDDLDGMSVASASQWSESHEVDHGLAAAHGGQAAGGVGAAAPHHGEYWNDWGRAQWQAAQWTRTDQHGRWIRSSWADQWEAERDQSSGRDTDLQTAAAQGGARRSGGEHDQESGEPSAKHRRQVTGPAAGADGAATTMAGDEAATGTQSTVEAAAAARSSTGPTAAAAHEAQVSAIVERAIGQGVQPIAEDGSDLITLSPAQLARWASANLG